MIDNDALVSSNLQAMVCVCVCVCVVVVVVGVNINISSNYLSILNRPLSHEWLYGVVLIVVDLLVSLYLLCPHGGQPIQHNGTNKC